MKVAIVGYGKMGKEIEKILLERGHSVSAKLRSTDDISMVLGSDVAIEFTRPESAIDNISFCLKNNVPVVVGTTGWLEQLGEMEALVEETKGALLYASNFSLGVNIFFELNEYLAKMMDTVDGYNVDVQEIHHTEKLDAPSGTGISIAEGIINNSSEFTSWENAKKSQKSGGSVLNIESLRLPNVPGTHEVVYDSEIDKISIEHVAHNRIGFAKGSVVAAEFLHGKQGVYTMKDVLNIK